MKEITIQNKIYAMRGKQIMLDKDLAELYGIKSKRLNEQVKRNIERFPNDFMFQLTEKEFNDLKSQIVIPNLRSQNATSRLGHGGRRYLPYAFTEQGVAMLSSVLKSKTAISVNILIIRAFVYMKKMISSNLLTFQRLNKLETKQLEHDQKFEKVFKAIESKDIKPSKGIFFNGQVFDAYKFISDLIRSAKKEIILIDNFIDDSVLTLFTKRKKNVNVIIYTKEITKQLTFDVEKHNNQYPKIEIKRFSDSHDRFMIIDNKDVYHIGASLKDLGKKWFGFSKFDKEIKNILSKLL